MTKFIEYPIYRGFLGIMLNPNISDVTKYYPDFDEDIYAHTLFVPYKNKQCTLIVLNFSNPNRAVDMGTIAHEATHATHMILNARGVHADFVNDEPIAYLIDWVVQQIDIFMRKNKINL